MSLRTAPIVDFFATRLSSRSQLHRSRQPSQIARSHRSPLWILSCEDTYSRCGSALFFLQSASTAPYDLNERQTKRRPLRRATVLISGIERKALRSETGDLTITTVQKFVEDTEINLIAVGQQWCVTNVLRDKLNATISEHGLHTTLMLTGITE